jgi:hypothetical protein
MNKLMTSSQNIVEDEKEMLIEVSREEKCSDEEVVERMEKFSNVLSIFDALFSMARTSSRLIAKKFGNFALKLWRGLDLSIMQKSPCN